MVAVISQTVRIDTTLDDWTFYNRSADFVNNMATALGIDTSNVVITSIKEGSVIIDYNLIVDENSSLSADDLKTLSEIMISSGVIDLGGALLNFDQG